MDYAVFPGQVLRARVWNFAIHEYEEFSEKQVKDAIWSTSLDYVIPTVLYLGLGGDLNHYNVNPLRKLVLTGQDSFVIELTLRTEEGQPNVIVERRYNLEFNLSEWIVDGIPCSSAHVCELVELFTNFA